MRKSGGDIIIRIFRIIYVLYNEYHCMSKDKCKCQDLNMYHHLNKWENTQL